jgi:glycosyltransferase involved in cell wall biosynthesis
MTTFAMTMAKDEADVIEGTVSRMLAEVDAVIVADNGSTDGTREILDELPVQVIDDPEVGYYQARKMSALAALAAEQGATWVVPFDADEVWASPHGRIADVLAGVDPCVAVAPAPILNYVAAADDHPALPPLERIRWRRREPLGLPKVACRPVLPATIEQGNHGANYPTEIVHGLLEVHHFPYRSAEQFLSKVRNGAAAYKATDLPYGTGQHWREYGALLERDGPEGVEAWFREHFVADDPTSDPDLILSPCPLL